MTRAISPVGLALIKSFEGCVLTPYRDQAGVWTCGWGATGAGITPGVPWTQEQADARLVSDLAARVPAVDRLVSYPVSANQFSAFCSLAFNIGIAAFAGSSALHLANSGQLGLVPAHILLWDKIEEHGALTVSAGLNRRRRAEGLLWGLDDAAPVPNFQALVV